MNKSWLLLLLILLAVVASMACEAKKNNLRIAFAWPTPQPGVVSLANTQSVTIDVYKWNGQPVARHKVLTRPSQGSQSALTLNAVPAGTYYFHAIALADTNTNGQILGQGWGTVTAAAQPVTVNITTERTANTKLIIAPGNPTLNTGDSLQLYAIALNPDNAVVLLPGAFSWATSNKYNISVNDRGVVKAHIASNETITATNTTAALIGTTTVRARNMVGGG